MKFIVNFLTITALLLGLSFAAEKPSKEKTPLEQGKKQITEEQWNKMMEEGKRRYRSCAICHGTSGEVTAPGQLENRNILGRDFHALFNELSGYRAGTADNGGLAVVMTVNMDEWSDEEIKQVSRYINERLRKPYLKKQKKKTKKKETDEE